MTLTEFDAHLAELGYPTLATVSQPAGYHMAEHVHPFDACALILNGDLSITVAGVTSRYAEGQIFRLPAGTPHTEASDRHRRTQQAAPAHPVGRYAGPGSHRQLRQ